MGADGSEDGLKGINVFIASRNQKSFDSMEYGVESQAQGISKMDIQSQSQDEAVRTSRVSWNHQLRRKMKSRVKYTHGQNFPENQRADLATPVR